ncbi:MAG: glutamine--fructose-6-phosphate transaminase (isomerizing) [Clostridia bacterium]|nr:glutamine--fructose-6-phosphate transaminase (isomerizing) [Clostridia bacterium]
MCGIIGRIGTGNSVPYIIKGLERLEYRGYDSAGVATMKNREIFRVRSIGKLNFLKEKLAEIKPEGELSIGHTRWATHGKPSTENSHPHMSFDGKFAIVHNGIIENAAFLKEKYFEGEEIFKTETDSEVIAHLLAKFYSGNIIGTIKKVTKMLEGSYALGIICKHFPSLLFCTANKSPLVAAMGENGGFIASDPGAIGEFCGEYITVRRCEIAMMSKTKLKVYDGNLRVTDKKNHPVITGGQEYSKGDFEHYMMYEMMQQPKAVEDTLSYLFNGENINGINLPNDYFKNKIKKVLFIACGSAYHVGAVGAILIEKLCRIDAAAIIASEFRYSSPVIDESTLAVFISQSGETADTLAALRKAREMGAKILSVVNVKSSAIDLESDNVLYTRAGKEVSVATTKVYSAQLTVIYALALHIAKCRESLCNDDLEKYKNELFSLPQKIEETINKTKRKTQELAKKIYKNNDIYYIGRQLSFAVSMEAALKMKEISYIHCESYAAGELKHGTISLIEDGTPVIAIAGSDNIFQKTMSNLSEVKARGAKTILITNEEQKEDGEIDEIIKVPTTLPEFFASLSVIPCQFLGYYTAYLRGCDIDKPKNLAKSVTVE